MGYFRIGLLLLASAAVAYASIPLTGVGMNGGSGPPPGTCGDGTIDLSTGCTQPMLGGL